MGAHGAYNALDTIIDAAIKLKSNSQFLFVFVGDGDEKAKLQKRVSQNELSNVLFYKPIPRVDSPAMLSTADAFLLPNRKGTFFSGNLPNKLFDFMAAAKPIVATGAGETPELIVEARCGIVCAPEDSSAMAKSLIELASMPYEDRSAMGARGRNYVVLNYDRNKLSERFVSILSKTI